MNRNRNVADQLKRAMGNIASDLVKSGIVKGRDKATGFIKVLIEPDGIMTDYIRYVGLGIAFGKWRAAYLPPEETEVMLIANDPDCKTYTAYGGVFNGVDSPPESFELDTILFEHENGNKFLLDADGMLYLGGKNASHFIVFDTWITNHHNPLVEKVNELITAHNTSVYPTAVGPTGVAAIQVATPAAEWANGDISTKFKGE